MKRYKKFFESTKIIVYHGSNSLIQKFDKNFSTQGVFWFTTDKDEILQGKSGASSTKYIIKVQLNLSKTAGWDEYEKLSLFEIEHMGFDSIKLDNNYIVFKNKNIKILDIEQTK